MKILLLNYYVAFLFSLMSFLVRKSAPYLWILLISSNLCLLLYSLNSIEELIKFATRKKSDAKYLFGFTLAFAFVRFHFFFFFFQVAVVDYSPVTSAWMHCSRKPQTSFFSNFFIKKWSYSIIHTFKNYFATVFSVFSF